MKYSPKRTKFDIFLDEKYSTISRKNKILCFGLSVLLMVVIAFFVLFKPNFDEAQQLSIKVKNASEDLVKVRKAARDLPIHQKELEDARSLFEATSVLLPKSQEIPNLLRNISDVGRSSNLEFLSFVPGAEVPQDFYAEIPIDIKIKGPYHNLGLFLDKVSKLERIVTVNNIKTEKVEQDNSEMLLHSSCKLVTYRFTNVKLDPQNNGVPKNPTAQKK